MSYTDWLQFKVKPHFCHISLLSHIAMSLIETLSILSY